MYWNLLPLYLPLLACLPYYPDCTFPDCSHLPTKFRLLYIQWITHSLPTQSAFKHNHSGCVTNTITIRKIVSLFHYIVHSRVSKQNKHQITIWYNQSCPHHTTDIDTVGIDTLINEINSMSTKIGMIEFLIQTQHIDLLLTQILIPNGQQTIHFSNTFFNFFLLFITG